MKYLAISLMLFVVGPASAQRSGYPCATHDDMARTIIGAGGERLVGRGLRGDRLLMELYVSPKGTFSVVNTLPSGKSCMTAVGDSWEWVK